MKTTLLILFAASVVTLGCASTGGVTGLAVRRGEVHVGGNVPRAVVAGPTTIHAYSAFNGGEVYTVPVVSGGDSDCVAPIAANASSVRLGADRVVSVGIAAGSMACLAAKGGRMVELLWHVQDDGGGASTARLLARGP